MTMRARSFLWVAATFASLAALAVVDAEADRLRLREQFSAPGWVMRGAALDLNFATGLGWQLGIGVRPVAQLITATRNSGSAPATSLLPSSPSGASYQSFPNGTPGLIPGIGLLDYEGRINYLLNSTVPATQTTASLAAGTYTLWVNGSGSATSSAGTAVGTGFGTATQGNQNTITITTAGTVVVTVSGSLNAFQLEGQVGGFGSNSGGTPLIVTGGSTAIRGYDFMTVAKPPTFGNNLTLFVNGIPLTNYVNTTQTPLEIDDGTENNRIDVDRGNANDCAGAITVATTPYSAPGCAASGWPTGQLNPITYALQPNNEAMANAGSLSTVTGNAMFTPSRIVIGANGNTLHQFNGIITRLAVWPTTYQPNAFLLAIAP